MKSNFSAALAHVLKSEGGYVNHPRDPGGCTNKGITIATYRRFSRNATCASLRRITDEVVQKIYRTDYWDAVSGDDLPSGVDLVVFDMAVNAGPRQSTKLLQRIVGVDDDGVMGPVSLKAVGVLSRVKLLSDYAKARESYYRGLGHFDAFGRGWLSRVASTHEAAVTILETNDAVDPPIFPVPPDPIATSDLQALFALCDELTHVVTKVRAQYKV